MGKKESASPMERWPNKFSVYCIVYTPDGRHLKFETDLEETRAERIVKELTQQMTEPEQ
jgi:hypothetical protein